MPWISSVPTARTIHIKSIRNECRSATGLFDSLGVDHKCEGDFRRAVQRRTWNNRMKPPRQLLALSTGTMTNRSGRTRPECSVHSSGLGASGDGEGQTRGSEVHDVTERSTAVTGFEAFAGNKAAQLSNLFPVWVVAASTAGLLHPPAVTWFSAEYTTVALAVTMLAMGTSLTFEDLKGVLQRPGIVALGVILQYTIMPLLGLAVSRLAGLSPPLAVGVCIVASCPGGTASNLVTYLAQADVALSVTMTTVSTLAAVVMTPLLTQALVGAMVKVSVVGLLTSTLQVVLLPVALGAALNQAFPAAVRRVAPFSPLICVVTVALLVGSIIGSQAAFVRQASWTLLGAVVALHSGGFLLGYWVSKLVGVPEKAARTNSIEVGMQNSALGAFLAMAHFADPVTVVPCAISACIHSVLGSAIAGAWRWRDIRHQRLDTRTSPRLQ